MNRHLSRGPVRYRCMTRTYAPEKCQCPSVKESVLEAAVLHAVQDQIQELVDAKAVIDAAKKCEASSCTQNEYLLAINRAAREKKRLTDAKFRLYDNFESGVIDRDEYEQFKERYTEEIAEQERLIEKLQASMNEIKAARKQDDEFVSFFEEYGNISTIDRNVLNKLLDHIEVTDPLHIDIYFKFSAEREKILDFARNIEKQQAVICAG